MIINKYELVSMCLCVFNNFIWKKPSKILIETIFMENLFENLLENYIPLDRLMQSPVCVNQPTKITANSRQSHSQMYTITYSLCTIQELCRSTTMKTNTNYSIDFYIFLFLFLYFGIFLGIFLHKWYLHVNKLANIQSKIFTLFARNAWFVTNIAEN